MGFVANKLKLEYLLNSVESPSELKDPNEVQSGYFAGMLVFIEGFFVFGDNFGHFDVFMRQTLL